MCALPGRGRSELLDTASKLLAGKRRDRRRDQLADADKCQLLLEDLSINPDVAQIGYFKQERPFRDILALIGGFLDDKTVNRRQQREEPVEAVVRGDRVDLILPDSQDLERLGREPEPLAGIAEWRRVGIGPGRRWSVQRGRGFEEDPDRLSDVVAIKLGESLARPDVLSLGVDMESLDSRPASALGSNLDSPTVVKSDNSDRVKPIDRGSETHGNGPDARLGNLPGCEPDL